MTENPPNLRHRRREYPVTPTQLFDIAIIFCFYWENKMLRSVYAVSPTVKNSGF